MSNPMRVKKSQPTITDVHVNRPLTNLAVAFVQDDSAFVGNKVFPNVPVAKKSDQYWVYDRAELLRSDAQRRAPGTPAARRGHKVSTDSYNTERWSVAEDIPDPVRDNQDSPLNADMDALDVVMSDLKIRQEIDWVAQYFTTGKWTGSTTGTDITPSSLWSDAASDPVSDIKTQSRRMKSQTAYRPNTLVLGAKTFDDLTQHPDIIDRIKYTAGATNPAIVNEQTLAALFNISRVMVCEAMRNSGAEGSVASYDFIAGARHALLLYAAPRSGIRVPSAGYTFSWKGTGNDFGISIKKYRRPEEFESDSVEGDMWYDQKVVSAILGVFFNNAVAA